MTQTRRFIQCDVFTSEPTRGNALAVVVDGEGLTDEQMQVFAAWTNLAETTFLFAPDDDSADYKVRIWTPAREMLFAGHPTLGSCAAWLQCGGVPRQAGVVRQQCGVGIVEIDLTGDAPAFVAPPTQIDDMPPMTQQGLLSKLGVDPQNVLGAAILNNGPQWHVFELASAQQVLAVDAASVKWPDEKSIGLIGAHPPSASCAYEVRMLAPSSGMSEDPITGSLNSALAHWMMSRGKYQQPLVVAQGSAIDRLGRVYVRPDPVTPGRVLIGGHSHILIEGSVQL